MSVCLETSMEMSGHLLDIVNYTLSLDISGRVALMDGKGRTGGMILQDRRICNAWIGEYTGIRALQVLADEDMLSCAEAFPHTGEAGPLALDYAELVRILEKKQPLLKTVNTALGADATSAGRLASKTEAAGAIPKIPAKLFSDDENVLFFGALMGPRVQCRAPGWPQATPETLIPLVRVLREQGEAMQRMQALLQVAPGEYSRCVQMNNIGAIMLGISREEAMPWTVFVVMRRSLVLSDARMQGNLELLWSHLKDARNRA